MMRNFLKKFFKKISDTTPSSNIQSQTSPNMKDCAVDVIDAPLNYIKDLSDRIIICSNKPKNFSDAIKHRLIQKIIDKKHFIGPKDESGGRSLTVKGIKEYSIYQEGIALTVNLCNLRKRKLIYTTTCTPYRIRKNFKPIVSLWKITVCKPI